MTGRDDIGRVIAQALRDITGMPARTFLPGETVLLDAGVDSLALLQLVKTLQDLLGIVVPDEVTARVRTVADLQSAVITLTTTPSALTTRDTAPTLRTSP